MLFDFLLVSFHLSLQLLGSFLEKHEVKFLAENSFSKPALIFQKRSKLEGVRGMHLLLLTDRCTSGFVRMCVPVSLEEQGYKNKLRFFTRDCRV